MVPVPASSSVALRMASSGQLDASSMMCCSDDGFFGTTRRLGDDVSLVTKLHDQMKLFSNDV